MPAFRLVQDNISTDTVEALETLLDSARNGSVIGMAFVAIYKRHQFIANATGEAYRHPVLARGMLATLDDSLAKGVGMAEL